MDSSSGLSYILLVVLVALSAFFSASETALNSINKIRMKNMADNGDQRAAKTLEVAEKYESMISTILIGNNIVNISASALATSLTIKIWGNYATGITTGVLTIVVLIFGEITPKTTETVYSEKFALVYAPVIKALMTVLTPVIYVVDVLAGFFLRLFHIDTKNHKKTITETELRTFVNVSHEEGVIESDERQIINNLFDFGDAEAKDVMIPRIDMVAADITTGYDEILALFRETMYSRIPVYEEEQDNVVGILNIKDLIVVPHGTQFEIRKIMRKPYYVYEHKNISELFKEMQKQSQGIAIVLDEYGSTAGMITTEDLLEEIVGEIRDEYDNDETEPFVKIDDYTYHIDGTYKLDDVNEKLSTALTSEDNDSIGGYIIEKLDRIPAAGEKLRVDNLEFTVEKVESNRVVSVILKVF